MHNSCRLFWRLISVGLLIVILLSGCTAKETALPPTVPVTDDTISVAVYPYIPDMALFQQVLTKQWEEIEPDIKLEFVDWDCYANEDPSGIDVITYDALFTSYLAENGYIQPIHRSDIQNEKGLLPFAVEGAVHSDEIYGIPFLVCSYFLMHDADDEKLSAVDNFDELYTVVSEKKAVDGNTGLMTNFDSDHPYFYLDAMMDFSGEYTVYEESPDMTSPDEQVVDALQQMASIRAVEPEGYEDFGTFRRGVLFNAGYGCAYYGYSEDVSFMDDIEEDITIRTISFSEKENIQLFFADIASMGSHVTAPEKKDTCLKLMNLIASEDFLQELCFGSGDAQYMLPARQNIYAVAEKTYPIYGHLYELAMHEQNKIFRFGPDIYTYLNDAYTNLEF